MRPLPRLLAVATDRVVRADDFPIRLGAIAASGSSVAIVVRVAVADREAVARRVRALTRPTEAGTIVPADPALARLVEAQGVELDGPASDLGPLRAALPGRWIGASVHSAEDARVAAAAGVDYLVVGPVFEPLDGRPALGLDGVARCAALGKPVFAAGGADAAAVARLVSTGAWGMAATRALFDAPDPAIATHRFLTDWLATAG